MNRSHASSVAVLFLLLWSSFEVRAANQSFLQLEPSIEDVAQGRLTGTEVAGRELPGASGNQRRLVPALNQEEFPDPEAGCGPAAILNWMLWWEQRRVLEFPREWSAEETPRRLYDRIVAEISTFREGTAAVGAHGTRVTEIVVVMDRLVAEYSRGRLRLEPRVLWPPVKLSELLDFNRGFRAGILVGQILPEDSNEAGPDAEWHAVSLVAADRGGGVMLNNWGVQVYGTLRSTPAGQVFRANNAEHPALLVQGVICFVPFEPL